MLEGACFAEFAVAALVEVSDTEVLDLMQLELGVRDVVGVLI